MSEYGTMTDFSAENYTVLSEREITRRLERSEADIAAGRVHSQEELDRRMRLRFSK
jgi:hypothetical protein